MNVAQHVPTAGAVKAAEFLIEPLERLAQRSGPLGAGDASVGEALAAFAKRMRVAGGPERAVATMAAHRLLSELQPELSQSVREQLIEDALAAKPEGQDWPDPIPLTATPAVPVFPVEALPEWAQKWVTGLARETQTPVDLPAMLTLGALATACAGRMRIHVRGRWEEPLNLFLVAVQPPATRKSAVFREHERLFALWEQGEAQKIAPVIAHKRSVLKAAEQRVSAAENKLSKATDSDSRIAADQDVKEANEAKLKAEADIPAVPRMLCSDVTAEQLVRLLDEQGGRMGCWDAEACGPFSIMLGRYAEGGNVNFEVFLKGHSGDSIRVDRVTRAPLSVEQPALTLVAMAQPEVLRSLGERREARGLGLLARILWFVPPSTVGRRQFAPAPMSEESALGYAHCVGTLLALPAQTDDPGIIDCSAEAEEALGELFARLEPQRGEGGDLEYIGDWVGKMDGAVARVAGLLHAAEHPANPTAEKVSGDTMRRAIVIGEYLLAHARAAFETMGADEEVSDAQHVLNYLRKHAVQSITARDLFQKVRGHFKNNMGRLEPALVRLVEHGYVRCEEQPYAGRGRKPSPLYHVHPSVRRRKQ
jgi:replicative DNA helicase